MTKDLPHDDAKNEQIDCSGELDEIYEDLKDKVKVSKKGQYFM